MSDETAVVVEPRGVRSEEEPRVVGSALVTVLGACGPPYRLLTLIVVVAAMTGVRYSPSPPRLLLPWVRRFELLGSW